MAPESRKPLAALNSTRKKKDVEKDEMTEKMEEESKAQLINCFLGIRSAINMAVNNPITIPNVEKDMARLLWLAVKENSLARSGRSG